MQIATPTWVRARALGAYWCSKARWLWAASRVARWRNTSATEPRLRSPSFHWAAPTLALTPDSEEAPLLITVEYRVSDEQAGDFLVVMGEMRIFRRREGAVGRAAEPA
ncbi:MAG TPA: MFS transporter [Roseiflexaceae bacterium]|nr:MFS transporter [Roseiflexaceae bacterium]